MRTDTAIMMTAWRRPQYLRRTLFTWAHARGIEDMRIVIALEPSERKTAMLDVVNEFRELRGLNIEVRENPVQLGVLVNPVESAGALFREDENLRYLIFAEEDLLVSDDVLEYLHWADAAFREDGKVLCVCAHSPDGADEHASPREVMIASRFRCWIWATWRDRWFDVLEPTWDRDYTSAAHAEEGAGWDWNIDLRVIPRGGYRTVLPAASRSQNIGRFEGVHADPGAYAGTLNPSFREVFGKVDYQLSEISSSAGFQWSARVLPTE